MNIYIYIYIYLIFALVLKLNLKNQTTVDVYVKHYPSALSNWTLIILSSEMFKFSIFYFFSIIAKENSEYLGMFYLLK
jgi:hypothetical protein